MLDRGSAGRTGPADKRVVARAHRVLGPAIAQIITGSVVVEQIFSIPGIGRYFVQSSLNRDYTMVMGVTVFYGALVIFCNLVADMIYGVLDPKVRYD